jgi:cutinase
MTDESTYSRTSIRRNHSARRWRRAALPVAALVTCGAATVPVALASSSAHAADCPDVEVVFARGSGEMPGLGITGTPLVRNVASRLSGKTVTSYAVNYAAAYDQSSAGAGATDMTQHVVQRAQTCADTQFVLGGYSQGASVTDIALGISTTLGRGQSIPADLAPRVAAVVVFGNPLGLSRRTIEGSSQLYGGQAKSYCNTGDPVCGGGGNVLAHLTYASNGSVADAAAFAAAKVN